jgi:hypothetical protein
MVGDRNALVALEFSKIAWMGVSQSQELPSGLLSTLAQFLGKLEVIKVSFNVQAGRPQDLH